MKDNCFYRVLLISAKHQHESAIGIQGFPGNSDSKESACNAGDVGCIPGLGRSPGEENGYPLQYSCLENAMGREAWLQSMGLQSPT